MSKQVYIYALRCPINGDVRYVGATVNPSQRLKRHMCTVDAGRAKKNWIESLKAAGLTPSMEVLEVVPAASAADAEHKWIIEFVRRGCNLVNSVYRGAKKPRRSVKAEIWFRLGRK